MNWFKHLKLWQTALIAALIYIAITFSLMYQVTLSNEHSYHKESLLHSSEEILTVFSSSAIDPLISEDSPLLSTMVSQIVLDHVEIYSVTIRNESGAILAQQTQSHHGTVEPLKITKQIEFEGEIFGSAEFIFNLHTANLSIDHHVTKVQLALLLIFVIGCVLLFIAIQQLFLQPLRQVSKCLNAFSKGDYTSSINLSGSLEILKLSENLNQLGETLENKRISDETFRQRLQSEVNKRTEELHSLYQEVKHQSRHDSLTGLANRAYFLDQVERKILSGKTNLALFFIDLDDFKSINDKLGHDAGDIMLKQVAKRLQETTRREDLLGRFGGDEFTVLLCNYSGRPDTVLVADKIIKALQTPFSLGDNIVCTSPSIGIATYPADANDSIQLFKQADQAMYAAKNMGKGQYQFYRDILNDTQSGMA